MIRFLHRNHIRSLFTPEVKILLDVGLLQNPCLRFISTTSESIDKRCFTTRDYLINSCGLSPQTAQSVAQKVHIKSTSKPNSVLNLFHNHGFSQTQISQIISKYPRLLVAHPEKTLKPKFDFFQSLGISCPNLACLISAHPSLLTISVKNQSIDIKYLNTILGTDLNVRTIFDYKLFPTLIRCNLEKIIIPNVEILRNLGVPSDNISKLFFYHPSMFGMKVKWFKRNVDMVREMGFDPLSTMFLYAVRTIAAMTVEGWERKLAVYKEFGWLDEYTLAMFRKQPTCMSLSTEKLKCAMGFFVHVLKWKQEDIFGSPQFLCLSMEKRIIPRCAVLGVLYSAGALTKQPVKSALLLNEKKFVEKYVIAYQESVPDVVKAYEGKIGFKGFEMAK